MEESVKTYVFLTLGACLLYAAENVLLERYLQKVSPLIPLGIASLVAVLLVAGAVGTKHWTGMEIPYPTTSTEVWALVISSVISVAAGICFYSAYTSGGNATTIPILVPSLPVFATIIAILFFKQVPDPRYIIPWGLVALAVVMVQWIERTKPGP
ncbi:hypothetical protein CO174_01515 [Candidatus Uhrbacteria bacterium CG_4_9_14_3_um_filter_50_9]|uniref:EamA domain-containing protein n=1 Tax=Candidatus Uhrbacteria bacterium CG_4_9_14_3_um_filter_50_9 TaxID=1975035 RepID=A0A2M7XD91_9BACT|nr:MAG: hypothetical protein CO174_01515 [Candidatus Uhrbacteria bacterium CG_4_9_14_3_um_filter_50_9]